MKMKNKNLIPSYPNQNKILMGLFWLSLILLVYIFSSFIWVIGTAVVLYIVFKPFNDFLSKYIKSKALRIIMISLEVLVFIIGPFIFILMSLVDQTFQLYQYVQSLIDSGYFRDLKSKAKILELLDTMSIDSESILNYAVSYAQEGFMKIMSIISTLITLPVMLVFKIITMMMIFVFLLSEGNRLGNVILKILPFEASVCGEIYDKLVLTVKTLMAGNLLIMILQGSIVGICFWVIGVRAPLLWGSIAALVSIIPVVGTTLVWVPVAIYLLLTEAYLSALLLSLVCFLGYQLLESFVKPYLLGEKLNFNSIVFFFLILGSIGVFGIAGIIVGPLVLVMVHTLYDIYVRIRYSESETVVVKKPKKVAKL
jgi:predicted PurR-regulated permease PerM